MGLKELTKEVHQDAERQGFVKVLMSGEMSEELYAEFLYNQHAIYNLLEACAMAHGADVQIQDQAVRAAVAGTVAPLVSPRCTSGVPKGA